MPVDLQVYRARFDEVCRTKFKRAYRFEQIEKVFAYLRSANQWLTARHIEKLFDPANTPFAQYWPQPDLKRLDAVLREQHLALAPLGDDPRPLIRRLLALLHNIGTVSLILRFTYPERFGVFSTPVINLLQVQRPKTTDLYLAYCDELLIWTGHFRLRSVAETEMALWTYQQLSSAEPLVDGPADAGPSRAGGRLDSDVWAQRRRAAQVLRPFLRNYGSLEVARILAEESPKLAGMIAGEEYERRLRSAARRYYPTARLEGAGWADNVINRMVQDGHVALEDRQRLDEVWKRRNAAVHGDEDEVVDSRLDAINVERMIDAIESICSRWLRKGSAGRPSR